MPLPDAQPKPAGSNIYHQLNSTKLGDLTNAEFSIVRDPLFLNDRSEDELRRLALIGQARQSLSASSSGPIPNTGLMTNVTATVSGAANEILQPGPGEVYQVMGLSYVVTGISGSLSHLISLKGVYSGAPGGTVTIAEKSSTDAGDNFGDIDFSPLHIDENFQLQYYVYGTFTNVVVRGAFIRIR